MKTLLSLLITLLSFAQTPFVLGATPEAEAVSLILHQWLSSKKVTTLPGPKVTLTAMVLKEEEKQELEEGQRYLKIKAYGSGVKLGGIPVSKKTNNEEVWKFAKTLKGKDGTASCLYLLDENERNLPQEGNLDPSLEVLCFVNDRYNAKTDHDFYKKFRWCLGEKEINNERRITEIFSDYKSYQGNSLPSEIKQLTRLRSLNLPSYQLRGQLPSELGELSRLEHLGLRSNIFKGPIPTELGRLGELKHLDLNGNFLTGHIPTELGRLRNLENLDLYNNKVTGTIPTELGRLKLLKKLILHHNKLTGPIPTELGNLSSLQRLLLGQNKLTGKISTELGRLEKLEELDLHRNQFKGEIPTELGKLSSITDLYLFENELTGNIPTELGNLSKLTILSLSYNPLTGTVPSELKNTNPGIYREKTFIK